jgi:hypothetical protein
MIASDAVLFIAASITPGIAPSDGSSALPRFETLYEGCPFLTSPSESRLPIQISANLSFPLIVIFATTDLPPVKYQMLQFTQLK